MMPNQPVPTPQQMMSAIYNLAEQMNNNFLTIGNNVDALLACLKMRDKTFEADYAKALYMKRCIDIFAAEAIALDYKGADALEILSEATKSIEKLKAEGKEKGWQSTFNHAKQNVAKDLQAAEEAKAEERKRAKKENLEVVGK